MKTLIIFCAVLVAFSVTSSGSAQDRLNELLKERKELYKEFEFYEAQKSSFWGTKSKKDLRKIIATLKEIILKDSEIIQEINIQNAKKSVKVISKNQISQELASEFEKENNKLKLLLQKTTFDYNQLQSEVEELKSSHSLNNTVIFILSFIICALFFYLVRLKQLLKIKREDRDVVFKEIPLTQIHNSGSLQA